VQSTILKASLPLKLIFKHVKEGHQDQDIPMALLRLAWLNIQMDTQAKLKLLAIIPKDLDCCIPFAGWTCSIEGWSAVKNTTDSLCNHLNGKIIMNHWVMKERFSGKVTQTIDRNAWKRH